MQKIIAYVLLTLLALTGCSPATNPIIITSNVTTTTEPTIDYSHPYFPTQKNNDMMTARTEGILIVDHGYLRLKYILSENSSLLIWPNGFSWDIDNTEIRILDRDKIEVARVGNIIILGGGEADKGITEAFIGEKLPEGAEGPYWIVGQIVSSVPAPAPPLSGKDVFRSDKYHLAVRVPQSWGKAEGPEYIARPFEGQVAFNSWGEAGFWTHAVTTGNTDMYAITYSSETVMSQIQQGGAYIVLVETSGPPPAAEPTEYLSSNLSGLLKPQDWRLRADRDVGFHAFSFYKWGTSFTLQIACSPNASDTTVAEINSILESWQFDQR